MTTAGFTGDEDGGLAKFPPWLNRFTGAQSLADYSSTAQLSDLSLICQLTPADSQLSVNLCASVTSSSTSVFLAEQSEFTTLP